MASRDDELIGLLKDVYEHVKWRDLPIELLERVRSVILQSDSACSKAHPHEEMNDDCQRRTLELLSWDKLPYLDEPHEDKQ